jgi:hypothetical protein
MSEPNDQQIRRRKIDPCLLATLVVGFLLCFYGSEWGRVESWNPDQMALGQLDAGGDEIVPPPVSFLKPAFHSYLNYFLSRLPNNLLRKIFGYSEEERNMYRLRTSRIFTAVMFLGSILFSYFILREFCGLISARVVSALFATSAGYIAFAHFLTADIPVLFWMLAAFFFATKVLQRCSTWDYVFAGLLTGIATATKYNGLAVGISLVVAHYLRLEPKTWSDWWRASFNWPLILGLCAVVFGFVLGNPYVIIDFDRFATDFYYNYVTTPVYGGEAGGTAFLDFLLRATELYGWPLSFFLAFALGVSCMRSFRVGLLSRDSKFVILSLSVFVLYFVKFGAFPRMETRFTLPAFPFLVLATGPFWESVRGRWAYWLAAPLVIYGLVCSVLVGRRLNNDPRMAAQEWVTNNVPAKAIIESTSSVPRWDKMPFLDVRNVQAPGGNVRARQFKEMFKDQNVADLVGKYERGLSPDWYDAESLMRRNPDYIAINSEFYGQFNTEIGSKYYPEIQKYFTDLLDGNLPYRIVFDRHTEPPLWWTYPKSIDFLNNRMTILERIDQDD